MPQTITGQYGYGKRNVASYIQHCVNETLFMLTLSILSNKWREVWNIFLNQKNHVWPWVGYIDGRRLLLDEAKPGNGGEKYCTKKGQYDVSALIVFEGQMNPIFGPIQSCFFILSLLEIISMEILCSPIAW